MPAAHPFIPPEMGEQGIRAQIELLWGRDEDFLQSDIVRCEALSGVEGKECEKGFGRGVHGFVRARFPVQQHPSQPGGEQQHQGG
jgi:hypothetical protein